MAGTPQRSPRTWSRVHRRLVDARRCAGGRAQVASRSDVERVFEYAGRGGAVQVGTHVATAAHDPARVGSLAGPAPAPAPGSGPDRGLAAALLGMAGPGGGRTVTAGGGASHCAAVGAGQGPAAGAGRPEPGVRFALKASRVCRTAAPTGGGSATVLDCEAGSAAVTDATRNEAPIPDVATSTDTGGVNAATPATEAAATVVLDNAPSSSVLLHVVLPDLVRSSTG